MRQSDHTHDASWKERARYFSSSVSLTEEMGPHARTSHFSMFLSLLPVWCIIHHPPLPSISFLSSSSSLQFPPFFGINRLQQLFPSSPPSFSYSGSSSLRSYSPGRHYWREWQSISLNPVSSIAVHLPRMFLLSLHYHNSKNTPFSSFS